MTEVLSCSVDGHVAVVRIERPPVNALSTELIGQLRPMFEGLDADPRVRVVVVTGGPARFSAGFDIRELLAAPPADAVPRNTRFMEIFDHIERGRSPVIAAINGYGLGGGLELALACDFRVVSDGAVLALPEINLGGLPGIGGMQRLQRLVGHSRAKRMVLTGQQITAAEAYRIGLADEITDGDAGVAAMRLATLLATKAPRSVAAGKRALDAGRELRLADAQRSDLIYIDEVAHTDDRMESLRAFLEKRPPLITGR